MNAIVIVTGTVNILVIIVFIKCHFVLIQFVKAPKNQKNNNWK